MKKPTKEIKSCPICGHEYTTPPAISRKDNKTEICPACGLAEALADFEKGFEKDRKEAKKMKRIQKRIVIGTILVITLNSLTAGLSAQRGDWVLFVPNVSLIFINLIVFKKLLDM